MRLVDEREPAVGDACDLTDKERERAGKFRSRGARNRFVTGRVALRQMVGQLIEVAPTDVPIEVSTNGAPSLTGAWAAKLWVSVSHTVGLGVVAASNAGAVGIDVESVDRNADWNSITRRYFAEFEQRQVLAGGGVVDRHRAVCTWVLKEAYLKARGTGISRGLANFSVSVDNPVRLVDDQQDPSAPASWQLRLLELNGGWVCGLALNSSQDVPVTIV